MMKSLLVIFLIISIFFPAAIADDATVDSSLITDACNHTASHYDLCVRILTSEPKSKNAKNTAGLVSVAIEAASRLAINTSTYVDSLVDKTNDTADGPASQQCLADCAEEYIDINEQLDDAAMSLESKMYTDVLRWLEAARADVMTCQAGCKDDKELTKRNGELEELASIIIILTNLLIK